MTCDCCSDDEPDDVDDGLADHQAEVEVVVGDSDGFISASVRGGDGESSDVMVDTLREVLAESATYLDREPDIPDKGVE